MNDQTKQAIDEVIDMSAAVADEAVRHPWVQRLARLGFYTKGFLFVVIGVIALSVVAGVHGSRMADARGALAEIAEEPYGRVFLIIFVVGAIGHGVWNILRAITDVDRLGRKWKAIVTRAVQAGLGFFYLGLAVSAIEIVLASRVDTGSSQAEETFLGFFLAVPLYGAGLIALIGMGLIGAGFTECYNGLSGRYQSNYRLWEISGMHRALITGIGVLSFTVRAVLLVIIGYYFLRAAFEGQPGVSVGLDAALLALLSTTYGRVLVMIAAVGLIGHGIIAFYEAKYRRIC